MPEKEKETGLPNWFSGNNQDWRKMGLEWLNFARATTQSVWDTLNLVQDQSQKMVHTMIAQGSNLHQEYHKMYKDWTETAKKGAETYQKTLDNTFKTAENFFKA